MDDDYRPTMRATGAPFSWPTRALLHSIALAAAEGWLTDSQVTAAAQLVAEDARRQQLPVEHALVALKREWAGLADVRLLETARARDLLDALVTACIKTYYAQARVLDAPPPATHAADAAVALLQVIEAVAPAEGGSAAELDPRAGETLARALAAVPPDDTAALLEGLQHLLRALRRQRRPHPSGRAGLGVRFQPPAP